MGVLFVLEACRDSEYKDDYLFSISAPQHIAAHDVYEVGLRVQLTHQPAEPPPEPGHTGEARGSENQQHMGKSSRGHEKDELVSGSKLNDGLSRVGLRNHTIVTSHFWRHFMV